MGGQLYVDSDPGEGSCFTAELEVDCVAPQATPPEPEMPSLDILLVEDVELNVTVACALLNKLGHQVQVARDGTQALAMANPDDFDLILLDIQLPDMTGFDVAAQLLARYGDSLPPMVALTANATGDRQYYRDHGMQDVINKPLGSKAVREVIGHLFADLADDEAFDQADAGNQDALLDLPFLTDYASTVGKPVLDAGLHGGAGLQHDCQGSGRCGGGGAQDKRGGWLHRPAPPAADGPADPEPGSPRLVGERGGLD